MATKFAKPLEASQTTHVADMPPLDVVTEGIPVQEHIGPPPVAPPEAPPGAPERRRSWLAWALAGVIGALLVVAGIVAVTQYSSPSTSDLQTGPAPQTGQEYPTGEQASDATYSGLLEGPALPYAPYLSIPPIPSIASIAIPSIESIPAMSMESIESIPPMSIEAIPTLSIPSIPSISIPSIPTISIPSIPTISIPSTPIASTFPSISIEIPSISFPTFPSIPSISVPSIASIPPISIPAFPDM
jgi:hypothetical protein